MSKRISGSQVKYITALSPGHLGAGGSTGVHDLSEFSWATLLVVGGSLAANVTFNVERSSASNGTFAQTGASLQLTAGSGQTKVRSFVTESSAVWYKVSYDFGNTGSFNGVAVLMGQDAPRTPVEQHASTTVSSDVLT
jgi:hypothetical protein